MSEQSEQPKAQTIDEWIASLPQRRESLRKEMDLILQRRDEFIEQVNRQVDLFNNQRIQVNGQILEIDEMLRRVAESHPTSNGGNNTDEVESQA